MLRLQTCATWPWPLIFSVFVVTFCSVYYFVLIYVCVKSIFHVSVRFCRYCNSHLQVLGFIPKKERKKKNDPVDEVKVRHQMDAMAFSLTVPTLALKMPNGLDSMSLSPPGARVPLHYLETELEDPFAFNEEDDDLKKGVTVRKKLQSKLAQNRQRQRETEILKVRQEHFSTPPTPPQQHAHLSPLPTSLKPPAPPQGSVCKSPQPQSTSLPMQGVAPTTHSIAQTRQASHKRPLPLLPSSRAPVSDTPRTDRILMKATAFSPHFSCISRLQRLVKLCTQKHQLDADLFPHLGELASLPETAARKCVCHSYCIVQQGACVQIVG